MKPKFVTITGADDQNKPEEVIAMAQKYPIAEWALLVSKRQENYVRFPSRHWIKELFALSNTMQTSCHICGKWVRDICEGNWTIVDDLGLDLLHKFNRFQLNFHAELHSLNRDRFIAGLASFQTLMLLNRPVQFIFQIDGVNDPIFDVAKSAGINAVPLFDLSGGAGILPDHWPAQNGEFCGYAGGLSPENVADQIKKIEDAADGKDFWIDTETRVRTNEILDWNKVDRFIANAIGIPIAAMRG